jgi:cell wall-associated NlpC family hydrolase
MMNTSKRAVPAAQRTLLAIVITTGVISGAMALGGAALPASAGTPLPGAPNCAMFPADNVWNTNISQLPVDPDSAEWKASMDSATTNLHPDFGPSDDPSTPYGIPYTVVSPSQPLVNVAFDYPSESDPGPYPFGPDTPIEGGAQSTGDRHALMVNPSTCTLYELYDAQYSPAGSTAGSGAIWNLESNALRPSGWTSADAAGLPILPGLVRYDEVESGSITHAIRMTAESTATSFIWPARHEAGTSSNPDLPPMGARFRLKASYDISGYSPQAQVVLRAMQQYGLILADNGSNWYFGGTADPAWPSALVNELKQVPASAFEAVDESSLMVDPDSGQARQVGGVVSCSTAPGYRLVAADGGVFSFCAPFYGSMGGHTLNQPIVGMAATADGKGYWLVAADGGIFTFGDAGFYGSSAGTTAEPIERLVPTSSGHGYWIVQQNGTETALGDASTATAPATAVLLRPTTPGDRAVLFAFQQLGKPYIWGGNGPVGYDCSGLALASWEQGAGVSFARVANDQYETAGGVVALSTLETGDLVFWGTSQTDWTSVYHVALYVGGNRIVEATGDQVQLNSLGQWGSSDVMPVGKRP